MAKLFKDKAYFVVDGKPINCASISVDYSTDGHEPVKTMNKANRAEGYSGGTKMAELTIEVPEPRDGLEKEFRKMWANDEIFQASIEDDGDLVVSYKDCKIKNVGNSASTGSVNTLSITADALDFSFDS